jgi:hypothetical protein
MASLLTLLRTISVGTRVISKTGYNTLPPDLVPEVKIACRTAGERIACGPAHLPREVLGYPVVSSADREVHPRAQSAAAN